MDNPPPDSGGNLVTFSLLIAASVLWITTVVILLPRLLGHLLAFLANRASRNTFHIQIPVIHIYPLAGRIVAHSLRYTVPDGTVSVEELVLQIRWWRKAPKATLRHLSLDDAHTLDPLATETHELDRENAANFAKRLLYRLRRWWRRTASVHDPVTAEPPPLISLIAVGMRVRLVNVQANYQHVNRVLALARASKRKGTKSFEIPADYLSGPDLATTEIRSETGSSSDSDETKPFIQRVLELVSLRITSGAFYLCDMGESPLIRVNVGSAKVRYRYGAPACVLDECRKRFRVKLAGLQVSVADRETVRSIVSPGMAVDKEHGEEGGMVDNTDRMIRRAMAMGYRGLGHPRMQGKRVSSKKRARERVENGDKGKNSSDGDDRISFRYRNAMEAREARRKQILPCTEILFAETAIIDYVFDEPGPNPTDAREQKSRLEQAIEGFSEGHTEDTAAYSPPVCNVSILLRGTKFSYDTRAIADVERVIERLQPAFYDLMPLAMKVQSLDGRRAATGIQIEIDATPLERSSSREQGGKVPPLVTISFDARHATWTKLSAMGVRDGEKSVKGGADRASQGSTALPASALHVHAKRISVRTEIPYRVGAQQKTVLTAQELYASTTGVTELPVLNAKHLSITRVLQFPQVWNEVHKSAVDVILRDSQFTFVPDTLRVFDDVAKTIQKNAKKPLNVRYFVPFKESTRIRAEGKYKIVLSCSHDNAWEDIHAHRADDYGCLKIGGDSAELLLSQNKPTEFLPDAIMSSWTISLPNAIGRLELPLPLPQDVERASRIIPGSSRPSESDQPCPQRHRPPSLAKRVRSQLTIHHQSEPPAARKRHPGTVSIKVFQMGKMCKVNGKVKVYEDRKFLNSPLPFFLDSIEKADIHFKASSVVFDFNPHHVTNVLSMIRNYAGDGTHSLSSVERDHLHLKRKHVVESVLLERRFPTPMECMVLGLGSGQAQASIANQRVMDEMINTTFQLESLVIRMHDLPHALAPFSKLNKNVCTLESSTFYGSLRSNRMGLELCCGPKSERRHVELHCGYREAGDNAQSLSTNVSSGNLPSPVTIIENVEIRRRSTASPDWGAYVSELVVTIGGVSGCVLDLSTVFLSRIALASFPDQLYEDQMAAAALLSMENIELKLGNVDLLVLSTSSNASAERSGQLSRLSLLRSTPSSKKKVPFSNHAPRFLTGVTHVKAPMGLRFVMSNKARKSTAIHSRLLMPEFSVDILMSWGGRLTPWIDDATLRAQVAHAVLVRGGDTQGSFQDGGLLRRAAEIREISLELVLESRPALWSPTVSELQRHHIYLQSNATRGEIPPWCTLFRQSNPSEKPFDFLQPAEELELPWWPYLKRSRRAVILNRQAEHDSSRLGKVDSMSIAVTTNAVIVISPESLELANDIVLRSTEDICSIDTEPEPQEPGSLPQKEPETIFSSDVREMWNIYEASRPPNWTSRKNVVHGNSFRALETKGLKVVLLSPLLPGENRQGDPLRPAESADDAVELSFPLGVHFLEHSKTFNTPSRRSTGTHDGYETDVQHIRLLHMSIPQAFLACNDSNFLGSEGLILILREKSTIKRDKDHQNSVQAVRDDKQSLVCRIKSLAFGRNSSRLEVYACFGRVASIFMLMVRALTLENAATLRAMNARIERVCFRMVSASLSELVRFETRHVRTFFAEASKQCAYNETVQGGELKGVAFSDLIPWFDKEEAERLEEKVQLGKVTSLDFSLRNLSLKISDEDMVTANNLACRGGSTARANVPSALEGHVLNCSVGKISISIRDDIAASSLRMVSDVASFVRRATFSIPMLRYDTHRGSRPRVMSSELLSYSYENKELLKLPERSIFPAMNHPPPYRRKSNWDSKRTRVRNSLGSSTGYRFPALGFQAWNSRRLSKRDGEHLYSNRVSNPSDTQVMYSDSKNQNSEKTAKGKPVPVITFAGGGEVADGRKSEMSSPAESSQTRIHSTETPGVAELSDEDSQFYAYVAVPTAGETGPPRKRAKSRVRVASPIPPAFSDPESLNMRNKTRANSSFSIPRSREMDDERPETMSLAKFGYRAPNSPGENIRNSRSRSADSIPAAMPEDVLVPKRRPAVTMFVSCREILCQYFRCKSHCEDTKQEDRKADLRMSVGEPRLTFMSSPSKGSHSVVVTAEYAKLESGNDKGCTLSGSIDHIGVKMSIAQSFGTSTLPKVIASSRISGFRATLHATDMRSVLRFRENFKLDMKAILTALVTTKSSVSEMARATRLSSSKVLYPGRTMFSTMAFDVLFEDSKFKLEGFHPKDSAMCMSYLLDGLFFSVVASEDDSAALTMGIRLYGHGLALSSPSWPSDEVFHFPSLDARGVQWGESTGLPTLLKVSAEPLQNCTSIQGLRHVLFTVAGLMAFQNTDTARDLDDQILPPALGADDLKAFYSEGRSSSHAAGTTPFSRSFAAWERTKGVRMDLSIRPMSVSLVSGQVVALFQLGAITGIFEWNKLLVSGAQLHTAVSIPRISLMFMRMPSSEFTMDEITPNEHRASMSIAFEKSRIDVLKVQDDLTHTFTFRIDIFAVSGQLRPWRLVLDAAVWADEQEFVADLQSINYGSLSTPKPRTPRTPRGEASNPLEHRIVLVGVNVQRFKLAVPLLNSEEYSTARLALRATELHVLARKRFDSISNPQRNIVEVKSHFIGILWEKNALFSSHHARITLGVQHPTKGKSALFGAVSIVLVPGTWRICPRKDVVLAVLEAKNAKDSQSATEKTRDILGSFPDVLSKGGASIAGDTLSTNTERNARLLVESLRFKMLRTSGAIEGLDGDTFRDSKGSPSGAVATVHSAHGSQLTLPAFSVAMVRDKAEDFDLIDVDFSDRERGKFPPKCLQKLSNLLTDLFGAVTSDRQSEKSLVVSPQLTREVSRDVSILIRYGNSMYKAQEDMGGPVESKVSFFAGRSSSILVSLSTDPIFGEECSHTTVIAGISPRLALEITPVIEGSMVQSLRLIDARFLHGVNPCYPPQSIFHISKVTALLDAKTLLLTHGRFSTHKGTIQTDIFGSGMSEAYARHRDIAERNVMVVFGRHEKPAKGSPSQKGTSPQNFEPDIRLQLRLSLKDESSVDQADLAVGGLHVGFCRARSNPFTHDVPVNFHVALHEINLRTLWDIWSCRLRLQENLFSCTASGVSLKEGGTLVVTNILNRLNFESRQDEIHTMKLAIDALATIVSVPKRDVLLESTTVHAETSHVMLKSVKKIHAIVKKLKTEVRLLLDRELRRDSTRSKLQKKYSRDGQSSDSPQSNILVKKRSQDSSRPSQGRNTNSGAASASRAVRLRDEVLRRTGKRTRVLIKGDDMTVMLCGYQFGESQDSAAVSFSMYEVNYEYDCSQTPEPIHVRRLGMDFTLMRMTYHDDGRAIHSDLFRVPSPKIRLKVIDTNAGLQVELHGDLELKLGPGFYYWREFKKQSELTIRGITPDDDSHEPIPEAAPPDRPEIWDGRSAQVSVRLNPKIDVIGDLTTDMLQFVASRQGRVDIVPKHLYDFVAIPIEEISELVCDSLLRGQNLYSIVYERQS